jgi:DNA helicase-2/ATP-dependent DNA helicase PcrA
MIRLNAAQMDAVAYDGNVVITACPGSGKTRVLTARAIRGILELKSTRDRVIALTFTNRAADEIQSRLDEENVDSARLWAGTIHGFALEWILRPYAPYCDVTRFGFSVADEYLTEQLLGELKAEVGLAAYAEVNTSVTRAGTTSNSDDATRAVFDRYKEKLREEKLIDYDDVLYLAFRLLRENSEIAATLGSIVRLLCVDEVQDIQDLQYGILSTIFKAAATPPVLYVVGDSNQSIYDSLGALSKTPEEIAAEFGLPRIGHLELNGNYRSTQRIIGLYSQLRPGIPFIESLVDYSQEAGLITFDDQTVSKEELPKVISALVASSIDAGVASKDICVLAPHWWHVRPLARRLISTTGS